MAWYTWSAQVSLFAFQRPKPTRGMGWPLLSFIIGDAMLSRFTVAKSTWVSSAAYSRLQILRATDVGRIQSPRRQWCRYYDVKHEVSLMTVDMPRWDVKNR